jgi:hypothetical protein
MLPLLELGVFQAIAIALVYIRWLLSHREALNPRESYWQTLLVYSRNLLLNFPDLS